VRHGVAAAGHVQFTVPTRTANLLGITSAPYAHQIGPEQITLTLRIDRAVVLLEEVRRRAEHETRANELLAYAAAFRSLDAAIKEAVDLSARPAG
jgi:predicted rRNA methylase YqxC with S4 and FtsJ domains